MSITVLLPKSLTQTRQRVCNFFFGKNHFSVLEGVGESKVLKFGKSAEKNVGQSPSTLLS